MGLREQLQWEDQSNAREGLMSAYLGKRTPEQSAELLNKARELRVTPQQAALVTPEEDAERLTNLANIGGLQAHAPLLVEKMREPNYANVVRENLGNMGLLESIAWKLSAGDGGDPGDSSWKSFKNSWTRATGKLFSSANRATELKKLTRLTPSRLSLNQEGRLRKFSLLKKTLWAQWGCESLTSVDRSYPSFRKSLRASLNEQDTQSGAMLSTPCLRLRETCLRLKDRLTH